MQAHVVLALSVSAVLLTIALIAVVSMYVDAYTTPRSRYGKRSHVAQAHHALRMWVCACVVVPVLFTFVATAGIAFTM